MGRADEFARLKGVLASCRGDGGEVVLISGDAGVGKSRLISEATEGWHGAVLHGAAQPDGARRQARRPTGGRASAGALGHRGNAAGAVRCGHLTADLPHADGDRAVPFPQHFADHFVTHYGPTLKAAQRLDADGERAFRDDLIALATAANTADDGTRATGSTSSPPRPGPDHCRRCARTS